MRMSAARSASDLLIFDSLYIVYLFIGKFVLTYVSMVTPNKSVIHRAQAYHHSSVGGRAGYVYQQIFGSPTSRHSLLNRSEDWMKFLQGRSLTQSPHRQIPFRSASRISCTAYSCPSLSLYLRMRLPSVTHGQ